MKTRGRVTDGRPDSDEDRCEYRSEELAIPGDVSERAISREKHVVVTQERNIEARDNDCQPDSCQQRRDDGRFPAGQILGDER